MRRAWRRHTASHPELFARLRDFATLQGRDSVSIEDVAEVYRTALLGPSGQNDWCTMKRA